MKNTFLATLFLFALLNPIKLSVACDVYATIDQATELGCSSLSLYPADLPSYPYGSAQMTIAATFELASCPGSDPDQTYKTLLTLYNGNRVLFNVIANSQFILFEARRSGGDLEFSVGIARSSIVRFAASYDFTTGIQIANVIISSPTSQGFAFSNLINFGATVVEAPTPGNPQIIFNPNSDSNLRFTDFVVVGKYFEQPAVFIFEVPNPAGQTASYAMTEGFGSVLKTPGTFGNAYFGESTDSTSDPVFSPIWQDGAVSFTSTSQYIRLPSNPLAQSSGGFPFVDSSFAISFFIKIDQLPVVAGPIFSRVSSGLQNIYSLILNVDGTISIVMSGFTITTTSDSLPLGEWTQVTVYIAYLPNELMASISFGDTVQGIKFNTYPQMLHESSDDTARIGGFVGSMRNFKIFAPGAPALNSQSCIANCALDLGLHSAQCVTCSPNYFVDGPGCSLCDTTCASCDGPTANSCRSCTPPKTLATDYSCPESCLPNQYLIRGKCYDCPCRCGLCTVAATSACDFCKRCPPKQCPVTKAKL